jgi:hypothetical protein
VLPTRISRRRILAGRPQRLSHPFGHRHPLTLGDPANLGEFVVLKEDLQALSRMMSVCNSWS